MDSKGRLTRIDEWKVGQAYQWLKGRRLGWVRLCVEVFPKKNIVRFRGEDGTVSTAFSKSWPKRWVPVDVDPMLFSRDYTAKARGVQAGRLMNSLRIIASHERLGRQRPGRP